MLILLQRLYERILITKIGLSIVQVSKHIYFPAQIELPGMTLATQMLLSNVMPNSTDQYGYKDLNIIYLIVILDNEMRQRYSKTS